MYDNGKMKIVETIEKGGSRDKRQCWRGEFT
jgi:hypothetical protein